MHRACINVSDFSCAIHAGSGDEPVSLRIFQRPLARLPLHSTDDPALHGKKEMRAGSEPENSGSIRGRVMRAREIQLKRFASTSRVRLYCNAQMHPRHIRTFCELSSDCERLLERAMTQHGMTARAHDRILKVARTIADLEGAAAIDWCRADWSVFNDMIRVARRKAG